MTLIPIEWSPLKSNPLNFLYPDIDFDLATHDGKPVKITMPSVRFRVEIDGEVALETNSNVSVG